MRRRQLVLGLMVVLGCSEASDESELDVSNACLPGERTGLVALEDLELTGSARIGGSLFGNRRVSVSGEPSIEGDVVGAGAIEVEAPSQGGAILEGARPVFVEDPSAMAMAARDANDNDAVCIHGRGGCRAGVMRNELVLNADQHATLPSGTYYFENIRINGQARLDVDGQAVIYLAGPATFNGRAEAMNGADALTIIATGEDEIRLNGSVRADMFILAPFATVRFAGMQDFRGASVARNLNISGGADLELVSATDVFDIHCE